MLWIIELNMLDGDTKLLYVPDSLPEDAVLRAMTFATAQGWLAEIDWAGDGLRLRRGAGAT